MRHPLTLNALALLGAHLRATDDDFVSQWDGHTWQPAAHRTTACVPLGVTRGEHVFRDPKGRVWSVDLVTDAISIHCGLMPEEWEHPPSRVTPRARRTATWGD